MTNLKQHNNTALNNLIKNCLMLLLLCLPSYILAQPRINIADLPEDKIDNMHTIQIGAFEDREAAKRHASLFNLDKKDMAILYVKSNQRYWYILVYGIYDSGSEAIAKAPQICRDNNQQGCWARKVTTLDKLAKQARQ